jgi:hypothetical protein
MTMQSTLATQTQPLDFRAGHAIAATEAATIRHPLQARPRTLSGRPSCRIYLGRRAWILEFDTIWGGWMEPWTASGRFKPKTLAFPTLAAAVGYAERHGYDYRIELPSRHPRTSTRRLRGKHCLPKSWLALLSSNARNGRLYHA